MALNKVSKRFIERHPHDAVREIEKLDDDEKLSLFVSLPPEAIAAIMRTTSPADMSAILALVTPADAVAVLKHLSPNSAAACLRRMADVLRNSILTEAENNNELSNVRRLLPFPPDVVGAFIDSDALAVPEQMVVKDVIAFVRRFPEKLQDVLYVVNAENELTAYMESRALLVAKETTAVQALVNPIRYKLNGKSSLEAAAENPGWDHTGSMPVVDNNGVFLGCLTKASLADALAAVKAGDDFSDQPKDILIGLAETFLNTCSEILFPDKR